ncbi:MAG TPA: mechanosensitive ion channel domain-containing protein, partial [Dongiaceae bacterium]|nr:mechanosensitive ion channel domain-containing protein [Dongiaceae bacterium]
MNARLGELAVWLWPSVVLAGGIVLGLLVQHALIPRLARLTARTAWHLDDIAIAAIRWPVVLWIALAGARIAIRMLPLTPETDALLGTIVLIVTIFSVTWAVANFSAGAVRSGVMHGGLTGASLLATMARIVVVIIGLLVILQTLGIHITGIIAALGVGGLAVGLALQDTLANLFAGIRIVIGRKIRPGDYVRLESGQEGTVVDIGWGQTTIRQGLNNIVIVPNAKLAQAVTTNY